MVVVCTGMLAIEIARNDGIHSRINSSWIFGGIPVGFADGLCMKGWD